MRRCASTCGSAKRPDRMLTTPACWQPGGTSEGGPVDDGSGGSDVGRSVPPVSATAPIEPVGMTAEELFELPDDGMRHELVEGELHRMTPAGESHGWVALGIGTKIFDHVERAGLGRAYAAETGFLLHRDPDTVRSPDVAFVARE